MKDKEEICHVGVSDLEFSCLNFFINCYSTFLLVKFRWSVPISVFFVRADNIR